MGDVSIGCISCIYKNQIQIICSIVSIVILGFLALPNWNRPFDVSSGYGHLRIAVKQLEASRTKSGVRVLCSSEQTWRGNYEVLEGSKPILACFLFGIRFWTNSHISKILEIEGGNHLSAGACRISTDPTVEVYYGRVSGQFAKIVRDVE